MSGGKFAEAGYVSICNGDKVNIYDGRTATITVSEDVILKGVVVLTYQIMADTAPRTGHIPQHAHSPP